MLIPVFIRWHYKDKHGDAMDTFGYPEFKGNKEQLDGLMFWYEEGNGACDCNRAKICGLEDMPCGNEIIFDTIEPQHPSLLEGEK